MRCVGEKIYAGPAPRCSRRLGDATARSERADREGRRVPVPIAVSIADARSRHSPIVEKIANGARVGTAASERRPRQLTSTGEQQAALYANQAVWSWLRTVQLY